MSNEMVTWAFHQDIASSSRKFVLLALADFAGQDGATWATLDVLSAKTGLNRKTVILSLKELEAAGYLVDSGERRGTTDSVKIYKIVTAGHDTTTMDKQYRKRSSSKNGAVPKIPESSTVFSSEQYRFRLEAVPKTVLELDRDSNRALKESNTPLPPEGDAGGNLAESQDAYAQTLVSGDTEQDAFTPEELTVEPMPRSQSSAKREKERQAQEAKLIAIMAAFRHAKYGKPYTDPILASEFDKMRQSASDLVAGGVSPEQVEQATRIALERWESPHRVTLKSVAGNITDLLASVRPSVPFAPTNAPSPSALALPQLPEIYKGCLGEGIGDNTVRVYIGQAIARLTQDGVWIKGESSKKPEHCQLAIDMARRDFSFSDPRARTTDQSPVAAAGVSQ